jgi:hypothetical protein
VAIAFFGLALACRLICSRERHFIWAMLAFNFGRTTMVHQGHTAGQRKVGDGRGFLSHVTGIIVMNQLKQVAYEVPWSYDPHSILTS